MTPTSKTVCLTILMGLIAIATGTMMTAGTVKAEDPIERVLTATFRIANEQTSATCFLVWPEHTGDDAPQRPVLVTAAHALEQMQQSTCTMVLRVQNDDMSYSRQEITLTIRSNGEPLWVRHPDLDIAAMQIELPESTAAKPLPFEQLAETMWLTQQKLRVGSDVFIPGYPVALESNDAGWPVLRKGTVATHPLVPVDHAKQVFINASTFGGDSGAPVMYLDENDRPVIVGMVIAAQRQTDRSQTPFEERVSHMPLNLAITVQAPFIRQTVALVTADNPPPLEDSE